MNHRDQLLQLIESMRPVLKTSPGFFSFKDTNLNYVELSHEGEKNLKIKRKDIIGKSDYDFSWEKYAGDYRKNDLVAISEDISDTIGPIPMNNKEVYAARCLKYPIRNASNDIIGIYGKADIICKHIEFAKALTHLKSIDNRKYDAYENLTSYHIKDYQQDFNLTIREAECLFLLIRCKSAKEKGRFLGISSRTVEVYISNIKEKMGVLTKSEIISKSIELKMIEIIPKKSILMSLIKNTDRWKDFLSL